MVRLATLASFALALSPILLDRPDLQQSSFLVNYVVVALLPGVAIELLATLRGRRGGLAVAVVISLLLLVFLALGGDGLTDALHLGWPPIQWSGLVAVCQLTVAVSALRAWFLATSSEPARYDLAIAAGLILSMCWLVIPPNVRPRVSGNEAATIGDVRTVLSAQGLYASAAGGCYGELPCLSAPARCIRDYPATAPSFLATDLSSLVPRNGYKRDFAPGAPAKPPRCFESFAYAAAPIGPGRTGEAPGQASCAAPASLRSAFVSTRDPRPLSS